MSPDNDHTTPSARGEGHAPPPAQARPWLDDIGEEEWPETRTPADDDEIVIGEDQADPDPEAPLSRSILSGRRKGVPRRGLSLKKPADAHPTPLTPEQRLLILDSWQRSGLPAGDFAPLVGVSKHTLYSWKNKFEAEGPAGLMDKPKGGPKGSRASELTKRAIIMMKETNPDWGVQKISDMLLRGPALPASPSTVAKVLHEWGYELVDQRTRPHPDKPRRFEKETPNQMWQTDLFTFMLKRQNQRVHLVGFMDDQSRFIVSYGLHASQSTALVIETLRAGIASYGAPQEILTDNGSQYVTWRGKSQFAHELTRRGIKHTVAKPRRPQTLGKIERFWGTLWRDCIESATFADLGDARQRIGLFIDHYNFQRPHQGIGSAVPADRFFDAAPEVARTLKERVAATEAHVTNYKSVEDSTPFRIDDITALVGKNESGKTSILQALYKLHPVESDERYHQGREYPRRHLNEYDDRHPDGPATVVTTKWQLDQADLDTLAALVGKPALKGSEITISRGYDDEKKNQTRTWGVPVDETKALGHVRKEAGFTKQEDAALAATGDAPTTFKQLREQLGKIPEPTENITKLIAHLDKDFKAQNAQLACIHALSMPEFVYFSSYDRLPGRINIDQLAAKVKAKQKLTRNDEIALAFLGLAQLTTEDIQKATVTEDLIAKLESVSNRISKMIFKYWTQNRHLKVQVRTDTPLPEDPEEFRSGKILSIRIYNTHHENSVPFDERSTGFVWFFSFLVYFWQIEEKHGENLVLLLDEPGLSLHARAQGDLLRYFREELLPKQVIFSTHSPFMIPPDNPLCARTVEDVIRDRKNEQACTSTTTLLRSSILIPTA